MVTRWRPRAIRKLEIESQKSILELVLVALKILVACKALLLVVEK